MKSEFKIESAVYRVLYKCLCDKIIEEIYKGKPPKFKTRNRRELFDTIENHPIGSRLIKGSSKESPKYFYRLVIELNTDTIRGKIDPILLYNALFELGYRLDVKYVEPKSGKDESVPISKAQNLLYQFIAIHPADIRAEQDKVDPAYYINPLVTSTSEESIKSEKRVSENEIKQNHDGKSENSRLFSQYIHIALTRYETSDLKDIIEFIASQDSKKYRGEKRHFYEVASKLLLLMPGTIQNMFMQSRSELVISSKLFQTFCDNVEGFFLEKNRNEINRKDYFFFLGWRNAIYNRLKAD